MVDQGATSTRGMDGTAPGRAPGLWWRLGDGVRALLGLHRRFSVDGVRYVERSAEPLRRALSRRGSGRKDYDVTFTDGVSMRIRATPERDYADLGGGRMRPVYAVVERHLRPGMRVLDACTGTGYGAAWVLERVGPSGAVVALDRDRESVRYARSRYGARNIAFECAWLDALAGETDGSFDAVVCCDAVRERDDAEASVRELWRLVAPGGWMLLGVPVRDEGGTERGPDSPRAFTPEALVDLVRQTIARADAGGDDDRGELADELPAVPADAGGRLVVLLQRPDR